jgi:acetyl esterase/lipase
VSQEPVFKSRHTSFRAEPLMTETSRHLIDPELLELLAAQPTLIHSAENLTEQRRMCEPVADVPADDGVDLMLRSVPGAEGSPDIELRVYRPSQCDEVLGCVLHIHGGGFILGTAAGMEPKDRILSHELHCVVATVDYRLAPETRFPGNLEDCYAALTWLCLHAGELGVDPRRIGVKGDSAGGGLAAALALFARDRGRPHLAFQHLAYPMLDDRTCVSSDPNPYAGEFGWTRPSNHFGWSALLGKAPGSKDVSPYAAPARAVDLRGLPPTFLATAALDLFVDENLQYAHRLLRAGVPTEFHVYPGSFHCFDEHPTASVARAARRDSLSALMRFLRRR